MTDYKLEEGGWISGTESGIPFSTVLIQVPRSSQFLYNSTWGFPPLKPREHEVHFHILPISKLLALLVKVSLGTYMRTFEFQDKMNRNLAADIGRM